MIEVLFFARIREQLGADRISVSLSPEISTVADVIHSLVEENGPDWEKILGAENVVKAVNQEVVADTQALVDGDEVAFFPPVTGG